MQDWNGGWRLMDRPEHPGRRMRRWQGTWNGQPLRRDLDDRLGGGVASGLARWRSYNPTTVRIAFVIAALVSQGTLVPCYFAAWLLIPGQAGDGAPGPGAPEYVSIWSRARHDSRGITLAVGTASLLSVVLLVAGVLSAGIFQAWGWPQVFSAACLVLIWRNAPEPDRAVLRRVVAPLNLGPDASRRGTRLRMASAIVLLVGGIGFVASVHLQFSWPPLVGGVLILAACVLLLGPWWLRIARDLVLERQARARAEERADMAARVHDSVLQTLALIQRRADDPAQVTQVPADRKGLAESIHGRMTRHGGTVTVLAAVGEGAKVSLKMPRAARSAARE
jgi:phage shock protein PspC (stress-responsive transcriptional regulator)